jgi:hypothetical protein
LLKKFEAAANDSTIGDLWRDLALLDTRIVELLGKLKPRAAIGDATWAAIVNLSEERRRLILTINKCKVAQAAVISIEQFSALAIAWATLVREEFHKLMCVTIYGQDDRLRKEIMRTYTLISEGLVKTLNLPGPPGQEGDEDHADDRRQPS